MDKKLQESIDRIKRENNISAGYVIDKSPIEVEKMTVPKLENLYTDHPRLLMKKSSIADFRAKIKKDPNYADWSLFVEKSAKRWLNVEPHAEPQPYPPETVDKASLWRPYWRKMYITCQENLYAVRHLAVAGVILEDDAMINVSKKWLLNVATYDPVMATSRAYNDEASFRTLSALAWGFDWLYEKLTDDERKIVLDKIAIRMKEILDYLRYEIDLYNNPLNSHGVRCISMAIIPACIAVIGHIPEAKEYLEYGIKYYAEHYPPWGGKDGAWAEGPDYWNMALAYLTESFDYIKIYAGINMYQKQFYHHAGDFALYCMPVHSRRASFGDQSSLGDLPGIKLGYNTRTFAGINGNPYYLWYYNEHVKQDNDPESKFYNYGWWDLRFDTIRYYLTHPAVEPKEPSDLPTLKTFEEIGWAAFHKNYHKASEHVHLIFKSSCFGSVSHSHADQNAYTIHAYGDTLTGRTGYYVGYGTTMHLQWQRKTHSKNLILIDGKGQYGEHKNSGFAGHQDLYCLQSSGKIVESHTDGATPYLVGDATPAYKYFVPEIESYKRKIYFVKEHDTFVIIDNVKLNSPKKITWLQHTTFETSVENNNQLVIKGDNAELHTTFASTSKLADVRQIQGYIGVDKIEYENLEVHKRFEVDFTPAKEHSIVAVCSPNKKGQAPRKVEVSLQNNSVFLYINNSKFELSM